MSYDKDVEFMLEAYRWAEKFSTDPSTQNGAVLVSFDGWRDGQIVAWGANHFPQGVLESDERWQRPLKYSYVEHAERNAIFDAAARGVATAGLTMYVPWFACADCGRAIIQAGISNIQQLAAGNNTDAVIGCTVFCIGWAGLCQLLREVVQIQCACQMVAAHAGCVFKKRQLGRYDA